MAFHIHQPEFKNGKQANRPRANDQAIGVNGLGHQKLPAFGRDFQGGPPVNVQMASNRVDSATMALSAREANHAGHAPLSQQSLLGLILAGGQAQRMGGAAKGLTLVGDQTVLARVRAVLEPACAKVLLSIAAGGAAWHDHPDAAGLETLPDTTADAGPLAALARVAAFAEAEGFAGVLTAPWDCPFLPMDLGYALMSEANRTGHSVFAEDAARSHPSVALWRMEDLKRIALAFVGGERRLQAAARLVAAKPLRFADSVPPPFFNLNTPDDLEALRQWNRPDAGA
jgi:molybdenum cofactor guanylyltransferase